MCKLSSVLDMGQHSGPDRRSNRTEWSGIHSEEVESVAGLSKKQLEIKNQTLLDYIKAAICLLDDQTMDGFYRTGYTAGLLSIAEKRANENVEIGEFIPIEKWRIRYADGTIGYQMYVKKVCGGNC